MRWTTAAVTSASSSGPTAAWSAATSSNRVVVTRAGYAETAGGTAGSGVRAGMVSSPFTTARVWTCRDRSEPRPLEASADCTGGREGDGLVQRDLLGLLRVDHHGSVQVNHGFLRQCAQVQVHFSRLVQVVVTNHAQRAHAVLRAAP